MASLAVSRSFEKGEWSNKSLGTIIIWFTGHLIPFDKAFLGKRRIVNVLWLTFISNSLRSIQTNRVYMSSRPLVAWEYRTWMCG